MKKLIAGFCLVSTGMAVGADAYWVGGVSGDWGEASNWSPAVVPNSNVTCVHITNEVPVTISMSVRTVGALEFSGANHTITGELQLQKPIGGETPHVFVAEGCTATLPSYFQCASVNQCGIIKTGKGTLVAPNLFGYRSFDTCEVREGMLKFNAAKVNGLCIVRSGAKLVATSNNGFTDVANTIVELEDGAVFDGGDCAFSFGGVRGAGIVTNFHNTSGSYPVMTAGPLAFSGRFYGKFAYHPKTEHVSEEDGGYLLVGSSNTLANATLLVGGGDTACTNTVRFAPGVGTFEAALVLFEKASPIVLEDTDGTPIRFMLPLADSDGTAYFAGKGDVVKTTAHAYTVKGSDYAATGTLFVQYGKVTAGTGTASEDAVGLEKLGTLEVASDATFTMKNAAASDWSSTRIAGVGKVNLSGAGDWTIGDLSLSGGLLVVDETAAASSLTIAGGASTTAYSVGPQTFETVISGGDHVFTKTLDGKFGRTYRQTGGTVTAELDAGGADGMSASFYTMTGGRLFCSMTGYRALGLDLSGGAEVDVRAGSVYPLLTQDGNGHEIRLRDRAVLRVDRLAFGFPSSAGTGVIRLDGGLLEVSDWIGYISGATAESPIRTELLFNGGVLRGTPKSGDVIWSKYADPGLTIGKVQAGGAKIDVVGNAGNQTLTLTWPFVSDVEDGVDGGFQKTGGAGLKLQKWCAVTGPFKIAGGRVVSTYAMADEPVAGCGNVILDGGDLTIQGGVASPLCANEGASLSFAQAASLTLAQNGVLTVGASSASANSVLNRIGHGILVISSGVEGGRLGSAATVTVNGGVAVETTADRIALPIFERCQLSASGIHTQQRLRFLTCDGSNRLVPAATVAFAPSSSTRATVAEISGNNKVVMTDDAEVGALNVEYEGASSEGRRGLTIGEGRTLHLGPNRVGAIAPLILNNTYAGDAGSASVVGGTIDFGASEGVIVLNYRHGDTVMMPQVSSVLVGTGGLTIAAPMALRNAYAGALSLAAANAYSGGTWIEGAVVQADCAECFGVGAVRVGGVTGEDGSIVFTAAYGSDTFANPLEVAGAGPRPVSAATRRGVLVFDRGLDLTGGVTLFGDATFVTGTASAPVVFSAPVTGTGNLTLAGKGCVRFSAANAYAGDTLVESGVLEIADAGTLGTGSITVAAGATLRFAGTASRTVTNPIRGAGRIECNGASVSFSDLSGFSGDFGLNLADGAMVDLGGNTLTIESLSGSGRIVNGRLVLTGEIQPGGAHAAGTLVFAKAPIVSGATLVIDGTPATQSVDRFVVEEAFDLSGMRLLVPNHPGIVSGAHEIVTADAGLSGSFASVETPVGRDYKVTVGATEVTLEYSAPGLLLICR